MIVADGGASVLSSMGWVDRDAIWQFDAGAGAARTIPLNSGAEYCSLHARGSARFAVAHYFRGQRFEITVREVSEPAVAIARIVVASAASSLSGDASALGDVPALYAAYLAFEPWQDYVLVEIGDAGALTIHRLPWYDGHYDKDYQAIVDAAEVPGTRRALVSVQRSSRLIVQDLDSGRQVGAIDLGGGAGNPKLTPRGGEVWATDYDSVAVIRTDRMKIRRRVRLQGAQDGAQLFIGDLGFAADDALCIVPRPFSHDVLALDAASLAVRGTAELGREPLQAAMLANGDVIARDWKTGDLLRGTIQARP